MKGLADNNNPDFRDAMVSWLCDLAPNDPLTFVTGTNQLFQNALSALITEFLGNCRIGGKRWPVRVTEYANNVEGDRTL